MTKKILQQGAEAIILLNEKRVTKKRIKKSYRIPEIDKKIRKLRTRAEGRLIKKASEIIDTPKIIKVNEKSKEIVMDFIKGKKLSEELDNLSIKTQKKICNIIGESIAKIHDSNIIHGDLTTSNMIFVEKSKKVFFIDFGLGFHSNKLEDKAVDLHLLKQALEAKHFKNCENLFKEIIKGYSFSENHKIVLERLKVVEKRGRYKRKH